jgi:hypothetical protein
MRVDNTPLPPLDPDEEDPYGEALLAIQGNIFSNESLEAIYRGDPPGIRLLGATNTRLMILDPDAFEDRTALLSIPLKGVSGVAFAPGEGETLDTTTTVGILVMREKYLVICHSRADARELHDMLIWTLTN